MFAIFTGNILRGEPINIHSDGEQSRDFVHVQDVARAWVSALDTPATYGEVINLKLGIEQSVNHLCDLTLAAFNLTRDTYPLIHHPAQPGDMRRSAADITRARTLLHWEPTIPFEEGTIALSNGRKTISMPENLRLSLDIKPSDALDRVSYRCAFLLLSDKQ